MHPGEDMKDKVVTLRLDAEEAARLDALCAHHGLNQSSLIRMLLRKEERTIEDARAALSKAEQFGRDTRAAIAFMKKVSREGGGQGKF